MPKKLATKPAPKPPKDLSLLGPGESEDPSDYLLSLAAAGCDSDSDEEEEAVSGAGASSSPSVPKTAPLYATLVHVLVGPAKKLFDVHEELFCKVSPYVVNALSAVAQERERDRVYHVRHHLQKCLLLHQRQPKPVELLAAHGLLQKLEGLGKLQFPENIRATSIHKVLKAALKSTSVPSFDQWQLKKRIHLILTDYQNCLKVFDEEKEAAAAEREQLEGEEPKESRNTLELPNTSPETFKHFVDWLYSLKPGMIKATDGGASLPRTPVELVQLYTLAGTLQITTLQNLIVDTLRSISPATGTFEQIVPFVAANHNQESKLFKLVVRLYAQRTSAAEVREAASNWMEKQFLVELTALLLNDRMGPPPPKRAKAVVNQCEFHVHDKDNPRCK